jgi:hypothetical protein
MAMEPNDTTDLPATGSFDLAGWLVRQPRHESDSTLFASAHESHHRQLQNSTSYGAVTRVFHGLAVHTGDEHYQRLVEALTKASERIQEAFASWAPTLVLGWSRDRLVADYPVYEWHYAAMDDIVSGIHSPYLRYHAAYAVARACMQTTVIERVLAVGLRKFAVADLRERELPDSRFTALRRQPPPWDEAALLSTERLGGLADARQLTPALFDTALASQWQLVSEAMYRTVAAAIPGNTLDIEGHQIEIASLLAAAREVPQPLDLRPVSAVRQVETRNITLGAYETETFTVADPLPARLLPESTPPALLAANPTEPHLFATVRRTSELFANYALIDDAEPPTDPVSVVLRRTVQDDDGHTMVELLRIPDSPTALAEVDMPLVVAISWSLLAAGWRDWLPDDLSGSTFVLVDAPFTPLLDSWLAQPGRRFRYAFRHSRMFGRTVQYLVGKLDTPDGLSLPIVLRPLSHSGVRLHKAALTELYPDRSSVVEDDTFIPEPDGPLDVAIAHLIGEEVRFRITQG